MKRTRGEAIEGAAYHFARAKQQLFDPERTVEELARAAYDPGYGPGLAELEQRIREFRRKAGLEDEVT